MKYLSFISTLLTVLATTIGFGQEVNKHVIKVGPNLHIPSNNKLAPVIEPDIAINPLDPSEMIIATALLDSPSVDIFRGSHADIFYSSNSGKTWKQTSFPMVGGIDVSVSIDTRGRALFSYLGELPGRKGMHVYYHYSHDAGKSWSDSAISLGTGHDLEVLVTDTKDKNSPVTYMSSAIYSKRKSYIYVAKSKDGITLREVYRYLPNNLELNTFNPVLLNDGSLVIPYIDYSGTYKLSSRRTWLLVSNDSAKTFDAPRFAFDKIYQRSHFRLAADLSGRFAANRLYAVRLVPGADSSNFVSLNVSDDKGIKWSSDTRVDQLIREKQNPQTINVAVTESGIVGISWFDSKSGNGSGLIDLYFTASVDGGITFLPEVKITAISTDPQTSANGKAVKRWPTGGDYYGLESTGGNKFKIVWTDSRTGVFQLYHSDISIEKNK